MKKNQVVILVVLGITILISSWLLFKPQSKKTQTPATEATPTDVLIPTVDASVKVDLAPFTGKKEVLLKISGIPKGTTQIEYSLSYLTKSQGLQGVIGTITLDSFSQEYEKRLTLGTCSSGTCVYHEVVGNIKTELKFTGSYGEKVFTQDFTLN